jgi:hypothetical protein
MNEFMDLLLVWGVLFRNLGTEPPVSFLQVVYRDPERVCRAIFGVQS